MLRNKAPEFAPAVDGPDVDLHLLVTRMRYRQLSMAALEFEVLRSDGPTDPHLACPARGPGRARSWTPPLRLCVPAGRACVACGGSQPP